MPSFLIVHSQPPGGRADLFAQPPMLDVSGLGARLDWGDTTFEVPPGDHRVTISVAPVAGGHEGAVVTVRVLPETGTRVSFAPPAVPGQPSTLRVDGQWPADAAMAYYAARDQRPLAPIAQQQDGGRPAGAPAWGGPHSHATNPVQRLPQGQPGGMPQPQHGGLPQAPAPTPSRPAAQAPVVQQPTPSSPMPAVPPVGPSIGSTGSVPVVAPRSSAPTFGQMQGAVVEPGAQHALPPAPPPIVAPVAPPAWVQQQSAFAPPASQPPAAPPAAVAQPPRVAPPQAAPQQHPQQHAAAPVVPMQPPAQHVAPPHQPQQAAPQQQVAPPQQPGPVAPPAFGPGAPQHPPMQPGVQSAFGHQPIVRRDVYGRDRVDGDRSAPAIPTPRQFEDFARAERERHEAEAVAASRQQQGWYPDPYGRSEVRWHDGERWTPSVMRGGRREHDPV